MTPARFPASERLLRPFFARPTLDVARDLVGCALVLKQGKELLAVRLVEVEAYLGSDDPASHAFRGRTGRNAQMFETPGRLYVYFTYGMHFCMNVVTERRGVPGAVLLRAGEVLAGEPAMAKRRGRSGHELCNGPAKLCQAFGIERSFDGQDLVRGRLGLWPLTPPDSLASSPRVGIRQGRDLPFRFFDPDSSWVSRTAS